MIREKTYNTLVILGPTATGKSDLAVTLAKMIEEEKLGTYDGAEIISADSRQVYRGMDIGTGKISQAEMRGIPHHLLDVANPRKQFSVVDFKNLAKRATRDIISRNRLPIICGGTGFYIDSLIYNTDFPIIDTNIALRNELAKKPVNYLFDTLIKLDPVRANNMNSSDNQNPRRLIRAIEIASAMSLNYMADKTHRTKPGLPDNFIYKPLLVGLKLPTDDLRKRIHDRLSRRIDNGMIDEVRQLHKSMKTGGAGLSWKRMNELGLEYKFLSEHLQGKMSQSEMTNKLETAIWHYAKRQMTWFKRNEEIHWFQPSQNNEMEKLVRANLERSDNSNSPSKQNRTTNNPF